MRNRFGLMTLILAGSILSCGQRDSSDNASGNSPDTAYTGLEGTHDQAGQLSTDARPDTSGGQAKTETISLNDSSGKSMASGVDNEFIKEQISGNYDELNVAKLASSKSTDKEIKSIAELLVEDHSKALDKLRDLAKSENLDFTSTPTSAGTKSTASLARKNAKDFDKAWCELLIDHHKKTISKYEAAAKTVSNAGLKTYINQILPDLRIHLDKLMAYHGQVKS